MQPPSPFNWVLNFEDQSLKKLLDSTQQQKGLISLLKPNTAEYKIFFHVEKRVCILSMPKNPDPFKLLKYWKEAIKNLQNRPNGGLTVDIANFTDILHEIEANADIEVLPEFEHGQGEKPHDA